MSAGEAWSVEDEAAKLVESLKAAARATPDSPAGTGAPRDPGMSSPTTASAHSAQCQWCPVCRGARFLQSVSPETISRLADLASFAAKAWVGGAVVTGGGGRGGVGGGEARARAEAPSLSGVCCGSVPRSVSWILLSWSWSEEAATRWTQAETADTVAGAQAAMCASICH